MTAGHGIVFRPCTARGGATGSSDRRSHPSNEAGAHAARRSRVQASRFSLEHRCASPGSTWPRSHRRGARKTLRIHASLLSAPAPHTIAIAPGAGGRPQIARFASQAQVSRTLCGRAARSARAHHSVRPPCAPAAGSPIRSLDGVLGAHRHWRRSARPGRGEACALADPARRLMFQRTAGGQPRPPA